MATGCRDKMLRSLLVLVVLFCAMMPVAGQYVSTQPQNKGYKVEKGVLVKEEPQAVDSTLAGQVRADSIVQATVAAADSAGKPMSNREIKRLQRAIEDSTHVRHSAIFRDSIPISRLCLISMGVPGFGQLYNEQYWKIPIAYATLGASIAGAVVQNKHYSGYKKEYDGLIRRNASREELDPVQTKMIKYNTRRQLFFAATAISYIYFIGDAAVNYGGSTSSVKKATTLSTICPGAGQFYNRSYWKVPIVVGGFATMAYIIDFNNRGYKRFKLAYEFATDNDDSTVPEYAGRVSADDFRRLKDSYRRNRDLSIILTGAFYLLNIVDAHVDAQLKDYDVSDDLVFNIEPSMTNFYSMSTGHRNIIGMSLNFKF